MKSRVVDSSGKSSPGLAELLSASEPFKIFRRTRVLDLQRVRRANMERKPKERRVGMSKYETVAPHLKTVNGKRRVASLQSKATIRKDPDIDAAPLSSDSEKEAFQQPSKPYDSSEDESATHGVDIPRSGFANRGRPLRQRPAAASNARAQDSSSSPAQLHKSSEKQPSSSLPTGSFSSQHDVFQSSQGSKRKAVYGSQKGRAERIKAKTNKSEASPKGKNRNQSTGWSKD